MKNFRRLLFALLMSALALAVMGAMPPDKQNCLYEMKGNTIEKVIDAQTPEFFSPICLEVTANSCAICTGELWVYELKNNAIMFDPILLPMKANKTIDYTCVKPIWSKNIVSRNSQENDFEYGLIRTC